VQLFIAPILADLCGIGQWRKSIKTVNRCPIARFIKFNPRNVLKKMVTILSRESYSEMFVGQDVNNHLQVLIRQVLLGKQQFRPAVLT